MIYKPDFESFLAECVDKVYFSSTSRSTEFYINFEVDVTAFNAEGNAIAYISQIGSTIRTHDTQIREYREEQRATSLEIEEKIREAGFQALPGVISEERQTGSRYQLANDGGE